MKLTLTTTETVWFTEEGTGTLIAKVELTKHPLMLNGYDVKFTIGQGEDEPKETRHFAFSKPHPPRLRGQTEADAPEPAPTERSAGSRDAQARERDEVAGAVGQEDTPSE